MERERGSKARQSDEGKDRQAIRPWRRAAKSTEAVVSYLLTAAGSLWKLAEKFHTAEFLRSLAMHPFDPLWLVAAGILGLLLAVARAERRYGKGGKDALQADPPHNGETIQVKVLEQPTVCHLSASKDNRRMVTFPKVAVTNVGLESQKLCLRLHLGGWDAVMLPPFKQPPLEGNELTRLPDEMELLPGEKAVGLVKFRIPFSEPSEDDVVLRLIIAEPSREIMVFERKVTITMASFLPKPKP